jgi:hypothetical protein
MFGGYDRASRPRLDDRARLAASGPGHQGAGTALIRVRRPSLHTGQTLIVGLRRAQRLVWAPGVPILGSAPVIRIDRGLRRSRPVGPGLRGAGCPAPTAIAEWLHAAAGSGGCRAVSADCGRRRPVGRRSCGGTCHSCRLPSRRRRRHSRNWRHSSKFANSGRQVQETTPSPSSVVTVRAGG